MDVPRSWLLWLCVVISLWACAATVSTRRSRPRQRLLVWGDWYMLYHNARQQEKGDCVQGWVEGKCGSRAACLRRHGSMRIIRRLTGRPRLKRCAARPARPGTVCCPLARYSPLPDMCGAYVSPRLAWGVRADVADYPWMALLRYYHSQREATTCAASIISARYLLTAAHCFPREHDPNHLAVTLGEYDQRMKRHCQLIRRSFRICTAGVEYKDVEEILIYPYYVYGSKYHDVALVRLTSDIKFTAFMVPICLPTRDITATPRRELRLAGWGHTEAGSRSDIKLHAVVNQVPLLECQKKYTTRLGKQQLCAGGNHDRRVSRSCPGDSGGPLMSFDGGSGWVLDGIVNFGSVRRKKSHGSEEVTCGDNRPSVFTKVLPYVPWVVAIVRG